MNIPALILFASLPFGQLGRISFPGGIGIYLHDLVLIFLIIMMPFRNIRGLKKPQLFKPVLAFWGIGLLSLVYNAGGISMEKLFLSSLYLIRWALYALLYVWIYFDRKSHLWWFAGLFISGCIFTLAGFFQYFFFPDLRSLTASGWDPHYFRLTSTFLDPNFAGIMIVLTLFTSFLAVRKQRYLAVAGIILILALFLTRSRSSFLALSAGIIYLSFVKKNIKNLIPIAILILFIIFMPKSRLDVGDFNREVTSYARLENWQISAYMISNSPLIGFGFNTLKYTGPFRVNNSGSIIPSRTAGGIDNSLLVIFLTTGLFGFVIYAWIGISVWNLGQKGNKADKDNSDGINRQAVFRSVLIAVFVHSMFNNTLFYPWVMIWLSVFCAGIEKAKYEKEEIISGI